MAVELQGKPIHTIYDVLDLIRVRPGMWMGAWEITRLEVFLEGFHTGIAAAGVTLDAEDPPFQEFHDWVARRLGRNKNGHGWSSMLLAACGDERAAFDRFWKELDDYRRESANRGGRLTSEKR